MEFNIKGKQLDRVEQLDGQTFRFSAAGGSIDLPSLLSGHERYFCFQLYCDSDNSSAFELRFYSGDEDKAKFFIRFGVLPRLNTQFCLDLNWLDGHVLFPGHTPGSLKVVCHGERIDREQLTRVALTTFGSQNPLDVKINDWELRSSRPDFPIPDTKLVDEFGQTIAKDWPNKVRDLQQLKNRLEAFTNRYSETDRSGLADTGRSVYGGNLNQELTAGNGFFSRIKTDGRWYLVDPLGHAFFSLGPDCVRPGVDGRIDSLERLLEFLPEEGSGLHERYVQKRPAHFDEVGRPEMKLVDYMAINLHRVWGPDWIDTWKDLVYSLIRNYSMNTVANWSEIDLFDGMGLPYVTSLPEFPDTSVKIFRDFPDVFSPAYREDARRCARGLEKRKNDPLMIGYFLRNEPGWAFVDNLVLADEVLLNKHHSYTKDELVKFIKLRYRDVAELNQAYRLDLKSFDELYQPIRDLSRRSEQAKADMQEFSRNMLNLYIEIPAAACREVDPNHLILGMRWAWISDPDVVSGWEHFDVFSINCYATDPTEHLDQVVNLGVDLPIVIGEFHFGALDRGPTATGLEAVGTQQDRGIAARHYIEKVAAHPHGVGCHYFQLYDQFLLGRFDGENYNIGLLDICSQPYEEMLAEIREAGLAVYDVMSGKRRPAGNTAQSLPMIAY